MVRPKRTGICQTESCGETLSYSKVLITGRQHKPKFPTVSVCLLNLKHFIPSERGICIKVEGLGKKKNKKTIQGIGVPNIKNSSKKHENYVKNNYSKLISSRISSRSSSGI